MHAAKCNRSAIGVAAGWRRNEKRQQRKSGEMKWRK
jgi:hypothetical protein